MNKKLGFTLIEVMLVVVIVGVLAAVGLPKLFGQIAKAKASEIPVAASTYTKLQDAYLVGNAKLGSWKIIGYIAPGNGVTNNFKYSIGCIMDSVSVESLNAPEIGWLATNLSNLNDCLAGSQWAIAIKPQSSSNIAYEQRISYEGCAPLTLQWDVAAIPSGCASGSTPVAPTPTPPAETPDTGEEQTPASSAAPPPSSASQDNSEGGPPSEEEIQAKCDDLKKKHSSDKGNKNGWVHLDECGFSVPKGEAKDFGDFKNGNKNKDK